MAYIEITAAMVSAAQRRLPGIQAAVVREVLRAAFRAAEIRTEPESPVVTPEVAVVLNGDESFRTRIGGPPIVFAMPHPTVHSVQVVVRGRESEPIGGYTQRFPRQKATTAALCRNTQHAHFPGDPVLDSCTEFGPAA